MVTLGEKGAGNKVKPQKQTKRQHFFVNFYPGVNVRSLHSQIPTPLKGQSNEIGMGHKSIKA